MKKLLLSTAILVASNLALANNCITPKAPDIPNGASASENELIAAKKTLTAYQAQLVTYRECLTKAEKNIDQTAEDAKAQEAALLNAYNSSVDTETQLAEAFNNAIKAFKSQSK